MNNFLIAVYLNQMFSDVNGLYDADNSHDAVGSHDVEGSHAVVNSHDVNRSYESFNLFTCVDPSFRSIDVASYVRGHCRDVFITLWEDVCTSSSLFGRTAAKAT